MKYTAILVTERNIERPVQRFSPDPVNAKGIASDFLKANGCVAGDSFAIFETKPVLIATLVLMSDGTVETQHVGDPR